MKEKTLIVKSGAGRLRDVRLFLRKTVSEYGFSRGDVDDIVLAVDEACSNIIRHSYKGDAGEDIIIKCLMEENKLIITLQDFGEKPDMKRIKHIPKDKVRRGGFGLVCIKKVMDEVDYDLTPERGTILRLVKYKRY